MAKLHSPAPLSLLFGLILVFGTGSSFASNLDDGKVEDPKAPIATRAKAYLSMAQTALELDPAVSHERALTALRLAEELGDTELEHDALHCLAQAEHRLGLSLEFLRTGLRALDLARARGDVKAMSMDLQDLSSAYMINGNSEKALEEARNALALALPLQDTATINSGYQFLLRTLYEVGKYDELFAMSDKCLERAEKNGDDREIGRSLKMIGKGYVASGRYINALPYLSKAMVILERHGKPWELSELSLDLAEAQIGLGHKIDAEKVLARASASFNKATQWEQRYRLLQLKYKLAFSNERWQEAIMLLEQAKHQNDSVNLARMDMRMAHMQVSYELDRKEVDNALLREENASHAELIASQLWSNRIMQAMLAILAVIVTALFFTSRHSIRMVRRMKLKNEVIRTQHDQIHTKNMELQRQNMRLAESLLSDEEKEMMIKEIHHRTKNNLQVVDSLLQIQSEAIGDPEVKRSLREAQGRIRSMGLVHEHIYRKADGAKHNLQKHIENLVRNSLVAHGAHDRISVSVDAPMPAFTSDTLMPLTLVVNELFTNALKYAFIGKESGHVTIVIRPAGTGFELLFSDDGKGMDPRELEFKDRSFGYKLIEMLAEQMNGDLRFMKGSGTSVCLTFHPEKQVLLAAS